MRARNPVHDFGAAHHDAQRHAGSDAFRHANDIGLHSGVLDGPPLAGATGAALDFIRHQQNAVLVADAAQLLHEDGGRDHVSALALHRLDENCRHFFRSQRRLEQLVFDEAGAAQSESFGILRAAFAAAIDVGIAHVSDARNAGAETALLLRLGSGQRERAHGAAVESAEERDHVLPLGVIARQLERGIPPLPCRSCRSKSCAVRAWARSSTAARPA